MTIARVFWRGLLLAAVAALPACTDADGATISTTTMNQQTDEARAAAEAERTARAARAAIEEADAATAEAEEVTRQGIERQRRMQRLGLLK